MILVSIVFSAILAGCSSNKHTPIKVATPAPVKVEKKVVKPVEVVHLTIEPGVTNKRYIRSMLGEPRSLSSNSNISSFLYFFHREPRQVHIKFIETSGEVYNYVMGNGVNGTKTHITISFDSNDIVSSVIL